jgi:hypothetical protein
MTTLTNEEKLAIVNQHLKSVDYALYSLSLDLLEAQSATSPDVDQVASINSKITEATAKRTVLNAEKDSLTTQE